MTSAGTDKLKVTNEVILICLPAERHRQLNKIPKALRGAGTPDLEGPPGIILLAIVPHEDFIDEVSITIASVFTLLLLSV